MINKKEYAELEKKWLKHHEVYQRWNRIETRMPLFLKHIDKLKGLDVLELGCNAGIYGYEISKVAKSYIGTDQGECYINQANETKKFFNMTNATFYAKRVKSFIRDCQKHPESAPPINALFATFVLYHLNEKETNLIKEYVLPKCSIVIIMTRTSKRSPWKKYNPLKLHEIKNVEKYLESAGFVCKSETHYNEQKKKIDFGITIAIKENQDDKSQGQDNGNRKSEDKSTTRRSPQSIKRGRIPKGSKVLHAQQQTSPEGTDGILSEIQSQLGSESVLQSRQREMLPTELESSKEGMDETQEIRTLQCDTEVPINKESTDGDCF